MMMTTGKEKARKKKTKKEKGKGGKKDSKDSFDLAIGGLLFEVNV